LLFVDSVFYSRQRSIPHYLTNVCWLKCPIKQPKAARDSSLCADWRSSYTVVCLILP
jgi:hypothetical protein